MRRLGCLSLIVLYLCPLVSAEELSDYSVSWLGNSFCGEPGWVPQDVADIFVTPDGTVYTNVEWEEGRNNVVQLKEGRFIGGS